MKIPAFLSIITFFIATTHCLFVQVDIPILHNGAQEYEQKEQHEQGQQEASPSPTPTLQTPAPTTALETPQTNRNVDITARNAIANPTSDTSTDTGTNCSTPAPATPWELKWIGHDEVVPFKQLEPVTISEKSCHEVQTSNPYLKRSKCKGSGWDSQVYGRSTWYSDVWAIMYSWYFPKDSPSTGLGHRHDWEHVIVWIDNPDVPEPRILAVTPSAHSGYSAQVPSDADKVDGTSVKVNYESKWPINHA
ncbi:unnamed protein product [Phytophthora lilii]|uniref:Unnamed protein product n=1 Tax=Phytophthora lilii TaxID=2077276 RepID=A0A9W6WLN1_9STRA|nr:unnamed protein product [Phytophthora lilii]